MIDAVFAIPGDLDTPTGGYAYARRVIAEAPGAGLRLSVLPLPGDFPRPSAASVAEATAALAAVPAGTPLVVDGLAFGALPEAAVKAVRAPLAVMLHHPLGLETGLSAEAAAASLATEAAVVRHAAAIIVTSHATQKDVETHLAVPAGKITVAVPGLDRPLAPETSRRAPPVILTVASLTPRKGHDVLFEALARIGSRDWQAVLAGADDRDPAWAARLRADIGRLDLAPRIRLHGTMDAGDLSALYRSATIFCLPSRHEGYGMVFAEAMAHGLPVVAARISAAEEVVPADAGLLVPVDDAAALAGALAGLLDEPAKARAMGSAGAAHAATLPTWADTAARIAAVLQRIAGPAR